MVRAGLLMVLLVPLPAMGEGAPTHSLTFAPHWPARAEFAGYYVAAEHGFYARRGLAVTILPGGPEHASPRLLAEGGVDAASLWLTTAIQMRDQGVPLVNVAQIVGRSSLMLVAKKASGIRKPADLQGRRVGVWDGDLLAQPREFLRRHRVEAELVPLGSTINLFLSGGVDATIATWFNEYHTILAAGYEPEELTTFPFTDYGLNLPEDGVYCRAEALRADPAPCREFVEGSLEGWSYAFAHPDETVDIVMRYMMQAHVGTNAAHQRWMLSRMRDLMRPNRSSTPLGALSREDYERAAAALLASGSIASAPPFDEFYRPLTATP